MSLTRVINDYNGYKGYKAGFNAGVGANLDQGKCLPSGGTDENKICDYGVDSGPVLGLVYLASLGGRADKLAENILRVAILGLLVAGSAYKVGLLVRHRNDPEKRERLVSSGQVYPDAIRKFILDEKDERKETSQNHEGP